MDSQVSSLGGPVLPSRPFYNGQIRYFYLRLLFMHRHLAIFSSLILAVFSFAVFDASAASVAWQVNFVNGTSNNLTCPALTITVHYYLSNGSEDSANSPKTYSIVHTGPWLSAGVTQSNLNSGSQTFWDSVKLHYHVTDPNGGVVADADYPYPGGSSTINLGDVVFFDSCSTTNPPCTTNLVWNVLNSDSVAHYYAVYTSTMQSPDSSGGYDLVFPMNYATSVEVDPGLTGHLNVNDVPCTNAPNYHLAVLVGPPQNVLFGQDGSGNPTMTWPDWKDTGVSPTGSSGTPAINGPADNPSGSAYPGTTATGTNSPIIWQAGSNTNGALVSQQGFDALYDATVKGFGQNHSDLQQLLGSVNGASNAIAGLRGLTNGYSMTNYASESTLSNFYSANTNLLGQILNSLTNVSDTNGMVDRYLAAAAPFNDQSNQLASLQGDNNGDPLTADANRVGNAPTADWTIQLPSIGGRSFSVDCNPMNYPWVSALASFVRGLLKWGILVGLLVTNSSTLFDAIRSMASVRQATSAAATPVASSVVALIMAGSMTLALAAIPLLAISKFTGYLESLSQNPFSGVSGTVGVAVWLADQFFPLSLIATVPVAVYGFRVSLGATTWGVQTICRFLVG